MSHLAVSAGKKRNFYAQPRPTPFLLSTDVPAVVSI